MIKFSFCLALLCSALVCGVCAETDYPLTEDSKPHAGVPKGEVMKFTFDRAKIFPGTTRDYSVYVPRQYDPAKPACVYVNQDGVQFNAPAVFDKLIAKNEMPVTHRRVRHAGRVKARDTQRARPLQSQLRIRRPGRRLRPVPARRTVARSRERRPPPTAAPIRLSHDGNDRCIGGASSGAICAFTAAWERPDAFRRVFSAIGTYVGLRGGNVYPTLIRKFEPKPLRVFLQDGSHDLNIYGGDWWMANQEMERALTFAGYEVNHAWGDGGHDGKHATEIFPDAMRWLWKDWPAPVKAGAGSQQLQEILIPGEDWQLVAEGYKFTEGPAVNARARSSSTTSRHSKTYKIGLDGKVSVVPRRHEKGQRPGVRPRRPALRRRRRRRTRSSPTTPTAKPTVIAERHSAATTWSSAHDGSMLRHRTPAATAPSRARSGTSAPSGEKQVVDTGLQVRQRHHALARPVAALRRRQPHRTGSTATRSSPTARCRTSSATYHLHVPDTADDSGADGMRVDRDGRLYVATRMGIQVCDQAGRVNCIIPTPNGKVANLCFGGGTFDTLFATCGDKVFKRKLKVKGALPFPRR